MPYAKKPLTAFETTLAAALRTKPASELSLHEGKIIPNYSGGRAIVADKANALIMDCEVDQAKYSITIHSVTGAALLKNIRIGQRSSPDSIFGSGIIMDGTNTGRKPSTGDDYASNVWCDLDQEMLGEYKINNSEPYCGEIGNKLFRLRDSVMMRGGEAGLDSKTPIYMDSTFVVGKRVMRHWNFTTTETRWVIANSILLMPPGGQMYWCNGGPTRLSYYNCKFGIIGQKYSELVDTLPPEWTGVVNGKSTEDGSPAIIEKLASDPFERSAASFWQPVECPIPDGMLAAETAPKPVETPPAASTPQPEPGTEHTPEHRIGALVLALWRELKSAG